MGAAFDNSLHVFDIRQRPTLVEERCCRAVGSKPYKEPFGRASIYPVALETLWCLWTEPQVERAVVVEFELVPRSKGRFVLRVLNHRTGFGIVNGDGPEVLRGRTGGDVQPIGLP